MRRPRVPEANILFTALTMYLLAIVWGVIRGPESYLAGLLSGSGSIAIGVWLGLIISHRRGYTDPREGKFTFDDEDDMGG